MFNKKKNYDNIFGGYILLWLPPIIQTTDYSNKIFSTEDFEFTRIYCTSYLVVKFYIAWNLELTFGA